MILAIPQAIQETMHAIVAIDVWVEFAEFCWKIWKKLVSKKSINSPAAKYPRPPQHALKPQRFNSWRFINKKWLWWVVKPLVFWLLLVEIFLSGAFATVDPARGILFFTAFSVAIAVVLANDILD